MLNNYFKISWRGMSRQKTYSAIKIGGFALGVAACLLIALFIREELSFEAHVPNKDRIFRVVEIYEGPETVDRDVHMPAPFGTVLGPDYPEIEMVARINPVELFGAGHNNIRPEDRVENTYEGGFVYADPELLQMMNTPFVYGNAKAALSKPLSLVITRKKADKYFPGENPIGKVMIVNNDKERALTIGGVVEDFPENTHLKFDFFVTLSGREFYPGEQTNWRASNYHTYVLLREGVDVHAFEKKLLMLKERHFLKPLKESGMADVEEALSHLSHKLQPLEDIYLNEMGVYPEGISHGDMRFIKLAGAIAVFILLIACINFVNLSTAKSSNRAKEVGLRKVVGSQRANIINQFLAESVMFAFLSFALGLVLARLFFGYFNWLVGKNLVFPWHEWWLIPSLVGGALIVGVIAGIYPAFYLSSFRPAQVLKRNVTSGTKNSALRSTLVVFQFATSIVLLIGTFIIYRQMQHILTTKIGFDKEQVLLVQGADQLGNQVRTFKDALKSDREIQHVTISDFLPVEGTKRDGNGFWNEGKRNVDHAIGAQFWRVDHDYIPTLGLKVVAGRNFSADIASDSSGIIINQAMVKELNLGPEPLGKRIQNRSVWTVIGVVEDFHYESLKQDIRPLSMTLGYSPSIMAVKMKTSDLHGAMDRITETWNKFAPDQPIRYTFLDDSFGMMYEDVLRMGQIFTTFAVLAIIVACLGLYGLSSFMVEQRKKEISIRLVLGASVQSVFRLLTQNFVILIVISFLIAAPLGWYIMKSWVLQFKQQAAIGADVYIYSGLIALVIALGTISYQAIHASLMRPAENLRSE
ncbi:ABC transporter permease [Pseudochryseolinea flava]|uniref:ABC transporter permease n=2 Tax=Pseudochryseolinea flava TaxID=2059302 RepID=A0A364YB62_9BACT|nr:ABC transporter permease [Pseudochryseolinea flava]